MKNYKVKFKTSRDVTLNLIQGLFLLSLLIACAPKPVVVDKPLTDLIHSEYHAADGCIAQAYRGREELS